jgi:hypothetical protein
MDRPWGRWACREKCPEDKEAEENKQDRTRKAELQSQPGMGQGLEEEREGEREKLPECM